MCSSEFENLPVAGEYLHRDMFGIAAKFGKDTFLAIRWLGTRRLPVLLRLKASSERTGPSGCFRKSAPCSPILSRREFGISMSASSTI